MSERVSETNEALVAEIHQLCSNMPSRPRHRARMLVATIAERLEEAEAAQKLIIKEDRVVVSRQARRIREIQDLADKLAEALEKERFIEVLSTERQIRQVHDETDAVLAAYREAW